MKNLKKIISLALAGVVILGSVSPVFANIEETQQTNKNETLTTDVYFNQDSSFTVTIPKLITLDSTKTSDYTVTVTGDIASNEQVNVVPEKEFLMKDQATTGTKKTDVTATVTQDKESWKFNEFETIGNGEINAPTLTAGNWEGSFWFNISLDYLENESEIINLSLSTDLLEMGLTNEIQVNATLNGENVNDIATWESDNENITADNGLVKTKASAQVGDEAIVTVSVPQISTFLTEPTNEILAQATFKVVIVDMAFTTDGINETINSIDIKPGESKTVEVTIIPNSATGTVLWSTTATSGINLVKNGNSVTIEVADGMPTGSSYDLVANYGDYSKLLKINIVSDHVHSYTSSITTEPGCETTGVRTFSCECGSNYTETINATGHSYSNGACNTCGAADPNYVALEPGLYDANGVMLCTWEESGINANKDYLGISNEHITNSASGYYVLTNNHPTATTVVFPDSINKIGSCAFAGCKNLTNIIIPDSVQKIGNSAFSNCENLKNITIPISLNITNNAFPNCTGITNVYLTKGTGTCPHYTSTTYTYTPWYISKNNGLTITLEEGITNIGTYMFSDCVSLANITIPDSVQTIGYGAFVCCTGLTNITIPNSVTSISDYAFDGCTGLTSITMPISVTSIKERSFRDCTGVNDIKLTKGTGIGTDYTSTTYKYTPWYILRDNSLTITLEEGITNIGANTFYNCTGLTSIVIPDSVVFIGNSAFSGCTGLTSITIPSSVTTIDNYAFYQCSGLEKVTIGSNVSSIGYRAFRNCTNLSNITFENTATWYIGSSAGSTTTILNSDDLANTSTATTYLKSTYAEKYWTRK